MCCAVLCSDAVVSAVSRQTTPVLYGLLTVQHAALAAILRRLLV